MHLKNWKCEDHRENYISRQNMTGKLYINYQLDALIIINS